MDSQRLILLLIFTFSLVMLWDGWQRQHLPAQTAAAPAAQTTIPAGAPTPTTSLSASSTSVPVATSAPAAADAAKAVITTDLYVAEVSSLGGDISRLELIRHKATADTSKNFVLLDSGPQLIYRAQSGLIGVGLPSHKTAFALTPGNFSLAEGKDTFELRLEAPDTNGIKVTKVMTFRRGSYLIDVAYEINNKSPSAIAPNAYFQLERDGSELPSETRMVQTFTGAALYTEAEKYKKITFEDIAKDKVKFAPKANNGWIGIVQHYFVAAWLPQGSAEREFFVRKVSENLYSAGVILPVASIAPGSTGTISAPLYVGPQEQGRLKIPGPVEPWIRGDRIRSGCRLRLAYHDCRPALLGARVVPQTDRKLGLGDHCTDSADQGGVFPAVRRELQVDGENAPRHAETYAAQGTIRRRSRRSSIRK